MAIVGPGFDDDRLARIVLALGALADRSRLRIIRELERGPLPVGEFVSRLCLAQPTVSAHLAVLRRSDLVTVEVHGTHRIYSLANARAVRLLTAVERFLAPPQSLSSLSDTLFPHGFD